MGGGRENSTGVEVVESKEQAGTETSSPADFSPNRVIITHTYDNSMPFVFYTLRKPDTLLPIFNVIV
jgi:hypothetical protein